MVIPPPSVPLRRFSDLLACDRVQVPQKGPFGSSHLKWFGESAWIPEDRLPDFLEGEEHRPYCNTVFKTVKTEEIRASTACVRTKKRFHCTYGPLDQRLNIEKDIPDKRKFDNGKAPLRHTTLTGYSTQRGCTCRFYVERYVDRKHAVLITWVQRNHVDLHGKPCHGFPDKTAEFYNAHVAPRLSRKTWTFVEHLIRAGVSTTEIVKAHFQNLRNHWRFFFPNDDEGKHRWSRDMMLTGKDVKSIRISVCRKKIDYNTPDHLAVHNWTKDNQSSIFLYQQKTDSDTPFLLGWSTEWMIQKAATLGQGNAIAMDATFGTNVWDLSLFTVLAYDEFQNGIPIAWALMEKSKSEHLIMFLEKLKARVEEKRRDMMLEVKWQPSCFLIDVASEEILSLKVVFPGVPINLCLWHVRRAWTKNLIRKVKNPFNRIDMNKDLGNLMYNAKADHTADSNAFIAKYEEIEPTFTSYYKTYWHERLERWMVKFRTYKHNNQNTNGAVERWHHTLKMHLRSEKATKAGRKVIWLVHMLTDDMELFYWCMRTLKYQGAIRNKVKEGYVFGAIHKARTIHDSQVRMLTPSEDGTTRAEVTTYKEDGTKKVHLVLNCFKDNSVCSCGHSEQGNTCKHQIKVLLMSGYEEMKIYNLLGTKWGTCCGGLEYEQEVIDGDVGDGEENTQTALPNEVDICFPLKGFAALEATEIDDEPVQEYHEYSEVYFQGLVQQGFAKLQNLSNLMKNRAAVRLREWLEWIKSEEAIAEPPSLDDFPMTQFVRPEGAENSLKRKKDHIEIFWDKKEKGTSSKKTDKYVMDSTLPGWQKVQQKAYPSTQQLSNSIEADCFQNHILQETTTVDDAAVEEDEYLWEETNLQKKGERRIQPTSEVQAFVLKKKRRENDQQMLERLARESLNLNNPMMDFEPTTQEGSDVEGGGNAHVVMQGKGRKQGVAKAAKTRTQHSQSTFSAGRKASRSAIAISDVENVPKRRGRPLGSKNKPKAMLPTSSGMLACSSREPLGHLSTNVVECASAIEGAQPWLSKSNTQGSVAWLNSVDASQTLDGLSVCSQLESELIIRL